MGDAHKLEIAQFPTSGVQADYPAQFMVRKNGAVGQLDAKVWLTRMILLICLFLINNLITRESITRLWQYVSIKCKKKKKTMCGERRERRIYLFILLLNFNLSSTV